MMDFYWKSSAQGRVITELASCPARALLPRPWVSSDKAAPWDYPSACQGDKLRQSSPKKGLLDFSLPEQPPLLCPGLAGPFSLTKSVFHISACLTHPLFLQINHPLVLLGKHSPRSQMNLSPQGTLMSIHSFIFSLLPFFFPFLLPLRGSFQTGPLPVWPRGFFSELESLPILHHCFPVRYHTSSWAASSWDGVRNNCKGGLGSMCGRHDFSCWSPHCQDSA